MKMSIEEMTIMGNMIEKHRTGEMVFLTPEQGTNLGQAGFIEVNPDHPGPDNSLACFPSDAGIQAYQAQLDEPIEPTPQPPQIPPVAQTQAQPPVTPPTAPVAASMVPVQPPIAPPTADRPGAIPPQITQAPQMPPTVQQPIPPQMPPVAVETVPFDVVAPVAPPVAAVQPLVAVSGFPISESHVRPVSATGPSAPKKTRDKPSKYPYDLLKINQSFFVPDSSFAKGDAHHSMVSSIAAQNKKCREAKIVGWSEGGSPLFNQKMDKDGNPSVYKNGTPIWETVQTKRFKSYKISEVTEIEPVLGTRVFREPLIEKDAHIPNPVAG